MGWQLAVLAGVWVFFLAAFFLFVRGYALGQRRGDALWQETFSESSWPEERRRYKRRYLPYPVNYASLEDADLQEITLTHDVGKGGLRFPANYPLRQGSRLFLSIDLPRTVPLSLFGEVVWQHPRPLNPTHFDTGIKFVALSQKHIMRIADHF